MSFLSVNIEVLNKKSLKDIADVLHSRLNLLRKTFKYIQWYVMFIDVKEVLLLGKTEISRNICKLYFYKKFIEVFNLPLIFVIPN